MAETLTFTSVFKSLWFTVDEKTNLQPRPRKSKTLAAKPELPVRVEHEYELGWNEKSTLKIIAKCQIPDDNFTSQIDLAITA